MREGQYYIDGIRNNDYEVIKEIYSDCTDSIKRYVIKNSGTSDDALDVIQDGLIIVFKKLKEDNLELTSSFSTYLYSVCRFVWLKKLTKSKVKQVTLTDNLELKDNDSLEDSFLELEKRKVFDQGFSELPSECKQLMRMSFDKKSGKEIGETMGYSIEYVKRKKYKCKAKLIELVRSNIAFKELNDN